jgi:hypothetical protein
MAVGLGVAGGVSAAVASAAGIGAAAFLILKKRRAVPETEPADPFFVEDDTHDQVNQSGMYQDPNHINGLYADQV